MRKRARGLAFTSILASACYRTCWASAVSCPLRPAHFLLAHQRICRSAVDEELSRDSAIRKTAARRKKSSGGKARKPVRARAAASDGPGHPAPDTAPRAEEVARPEMPTAAAGGTPRLDAGRPTDDVDRAAARRAHASATRAELAVRPSRAARPGASVPSPEQRLKARRAEALVRAVRQGSELLERRLELGYIGPPASKRAAAAAAAELPPPKTGPRRRSPTKSGATHKRRKKGRDEPATS